MGKRVYGLKHATPKMKYHHMRDMLEFKADLKEQQSAEQERCAALRDEFADALDDLKAIDPAGWEAWYDDDQNIPTQIHWGTCEPIIAKIQARTAQVRAESARAPKQTPVESGPVWKVIADNTACGYAVAVRDFETVTGRLVKNADAVSSTASPVRRRARRVSPRSASSVTPHTGATVTMTSSRCRPARTVAD